ncbi:hypothetical protein KC19_11G095300 [Ceratodon purpureus]|uniref:Uncharacterized protein n=1 Tax=Ceratodon purpureus TaxID=3225 RepID=A0A8T0GCR7_CERPU|nr:hypothetical protein KC19_11G095300 [Ceratodon purpureus]
MAPWCAARKCPQSSEFSCMSYINQNIQNINNETAQSFVACCQIQCGISTSAKDDILMALQCGGATKATAVGTIAYLVILLCMGILILFAGLFRTKGKPFTFIFATTGSLVFMTLTGVFVVTVTSPFVVLQSVPALGAMNMAVFSYFFSGFRYGAGLGYECGPLVVFVTTAYALYKSIGLTPEDGPIRTSNNLALAMFAFTLSWIVHSVSYRLYGYRVEWRFGQRRHVEEGKLDPRFHMGAAQGHPTWRTPMGQSTSVIMTALAWSVFRYVWKDLALQECRPDWVFYLMLGGGPILITLTVFWNIISGMRCRTVTLVGSSARIISKRGGLQRSNSKIKNSTYPGFQIYKDFCEENVWKAYVQAAALQWMERNSLFVEDVPDERLTWGDKIIGSIAWALALCGLIISSPVFFSLMIVVEILGKFFEALHLKKLVQTELTDRDCISAAKVVEKCYVGENLHKEKLREILLKENQNTEKPGEDQNTKKPGEDQNTEKPGEDQNTKKPGEDQNTEKPGEDQNTKKPGEDQNTEKPRKWEDMFKKLTDSNAQRSINLHTLLDNTGPVELYKLLHAIKVDTPIVDT